MIAKTARGISRSEVSELFKEGRRITFPSGSLFWREKKRATGRVSISVARRAAKKATTRSTIRRRIQAALREYLPELHAVDVVVVWTALTVPDVHRLERTFREMIAKAGIPK